MRLFAAAILIAATVLVDAQCPDGIRIRPEWRDLTEQEKKSFINAISTLHRQQNSFNEFAFIHNQMQNNWHNGAHFFPAHRVFILKFEEALRRIDPKIVFPYWDWSLDAKNIADSPIWDHFTRSKPGKCVQFAGSSWQITSVSPHCLTRDIDFTTRYVGTTSQVLGDTLRSASSYSDFLYNIEVGSHLQIHQIIGGDMGLTISPNDPIFFLHHGMVDKLWNDWQRLSPENFNQINGIQSGSQASINDNIAYYNVRIRDYMNITKLCYAYANPGTRFDGDDTSSSSRVPQSSSSSISSRQTLSSTSRISSSSAKISSSSSSIHRSQTTPTHGSSSRDIVSSSSAPHQKSTASRQTPSGTSFLTTTTSASTSKSNSRASSSSVSDATPVHSSSKSHGQSSHNSQGSTSTSVCTTATTTDTYATPAPTNLPPNPPPLDADFCIRMHYNLTKVREIEAKLYGVYINVIAKVRRGEYVGGPGMGNTSVAPEATYGEGILGGPGPYAQNNIRGVKDYVIPTDQFTQIAQQLTPNYADSLNFGGESDDSLPTGAGMANFVPPIMLSTAVAAYVILLMF